MFNIVKCDLKARTVPAQSKYLLPTAIVSDKEKVRTVSAQLQLPPGKLINSLSYSHLELLVVLDDSLKRAFYEIECVRGNWSVRELKHQIASLYFEHSGLSKNKKKLAELVQSGADGKRRAMKFNGRLFLGHT